TSITCAYCHGADLRGAQPPIPESPPAPDLATAGGWPLDLFVDVVRTGQMPGGRELDPEFMPIALTAAMTDDELTAIHTHLATLADRTPTRQAVEG
ncbi:MAG: hypothetical protein R3362_06100, partial [Rhodothermales bacterium]|nr:hypothetical protein [Rhodothermales bacterium]